MAKFNAADFAVTKAKPLPIIMLLDESGSMGAHLGEGVKIDVLNKAVRMMLASLAKEETMASEFLVSAIAFGGIGPRGARFVAGEIPEPASRVQFAGLTANANTPLDAALAMAKDLIEDKEKISSRSYRPLVVLVCDGVPDCGWEASLNDFIMNGRTAKCDRMALAVGCQKGDGAWEMLEEFVKGTDNPVFAADQAADIVKFFKFVTMSVTQRTQSKNPNQLIPAKQVLQLQSGESAIERANNIADDADGAVIVEAVVIEEDEDEEEGFRW